MLLGLAAEATQITLAIADAVVLMGGHMDDTAFVAIPVAGVGVGMYRRTRDGALVTRGVAPIMVIMPSGIIQAVVVEANGDSRLILHGAMIMHRYKGGAIVKRRITNGGHAVTDDHRRQGSAFVKRILPDGGHTV